MASALISGKVAQFLKKWPPFNLLTDEDLAGLSQTVSAQFVEKGESIFEEGMAPLPHFFIVKEGSIKIAQNSLKQLIDVCDEGDVFGVRALLANDAYLATAIADEQSLLYRINVKVGKRILLENPAVASYFAMGFASGVPAKGTPFRAVGRTTSASSAWQIHHTQKLSGAKPILSVPPHTRISDAALQMSERQVGSVLIVDDKKHPIGIITDKDLRDQVATGKISTDKHVESMMSYPVKTCADGLDYATYLLYMMQWKVHHLVLTEDGTVHSPVCGIITERDLVVKEANNPAVLLRKLKQAEHPEAIQELRVQMDRMLTLHLDGAFDAGLLYQWSTLFQDETIAQLIQIYQAKFGACPGSFAWMALGSHGRGEQIIKTDQDHALVIEHASFQPYFLDMASFVSEELVRLGFEKDAAGIMASNEAHCLSLDEWKSSFDKWMNEPTPRAILESTIFFDFRICAGNASMGHDLRQFITHRAPEKNLFLVLMAKDALKTPPPLSFFRNFVLEKSGAHKDHFDLKLRVLLPLVDCARVFAMAYRIEAPSTLERYKGLKTIFPEQQLLLDGAIEACHYIIALKAKSGIRWNNSGRYIDLEELTKLQRQHLKNIFQLCSDLQDWVKLHFKTDMVQT